MDIQNIADCPTLPAVKNRQQLERALKTDNEVIFLLFGDILSVAELTESIHRAGKRAIVHLDLIGGLGSREVAVDFIARTTKADGIISTKAALIRRAQQLGLLAIQRVFLLDSISLENVLSQMDLQNPDFIEVLPGVIPSVIQEITEKTTTPLIAGGLIRSKQDVYQSLQAGAVAVSTSCQAVWNM